MVNQPLVKKGMGGLKAGCHYWHQNIQEMDRK
jgi:hypothetical protein